jgi:hypothetical protein
MVGIYIGIACLAVVVVALFVDNIPPELLEKKTDVKKEVRIFKHNYENVNSVTYVISIVYI